MTKTMHLFLKALSDPDTKLNVQKLSLIHI